MKRLLLIPVLMMFLGCQGVMNEFDRDAARAHSEAQKAVALAALKAQGENPICSIEFEEGVPVRGLKKIACFTPSNMAGMPQVNQYIQPEHPAKKLADGAGAAATQLPIMAMGMFGMSELGAAAKAAGGTHVTNTISGTGNTIKAAGQTSISGAFTGSQAAGILDVTTPAQVVNPVIVNPVIVTP